MKDKLVIICVSAVLIVGGCVAGFFVGMDGGKKEALQECGDRIYASYEQGYSMGYGNGKEYVVTHIDEYVTIPKAVAYDEVVEFLEEDKTDSSVYTNEYNCISFSATLKDRATMYGIKCAVVSMDLSGKYEDTAHAINAFDTTDKGIVYFDPQTDGERFGIYEGGTYYLLGTTYKITKVDIIW